MKRYIAFYIAVVATFGSLYTQLVAGWEPCGICTLQRVFMYPLVFIILAATQGYSWAEKTVLPVSLVGGGIAVTHFVTVWLDPTRTCGFWLPCHMEYALGFGPLLVRPVFLPLLASLAFLSITVLWYFRD